MKFKFSEFVVYYKNANQLSKIIWLALFFFLIWKFVSFQLLNDTNLQLFKFLENFYGAVLLKISALFLQLTGKEAIVNYASDSIQLNGNNLQISSKFFGLTITGLYSCAVFILQGKKITKLLLLLIGIISIIFVNSLRISLLAIYSDISFNHHLLFQVCIFCLCICLLITSIKLEKLQLPYNKYSYSSLSIWEKAIVKFFVIYLVWKLFSLLLYQFSFLTNIMLYMNDLLTYIILYLSKLFLKIFELNTVISGDRITGYNCYVYIHEGCLGIEALAVFTLFISIYPGNLKSKFFVIPFGIISIFILNILRISILFILLTKGIKNINFHHEIYNYTIYSVIILIWYWWIKKYGIK